MAAFTNLPKPKLVGTVKFKLSEETRKILYRLYGLAEAVYYDYYAHDESKESITIAEEPEDHNGDEWTMLKSDYNLIRKVISGFNDFSLLRGTFAVSGISTLVDEIKSEWPMAQPNSTLPIMEINYPTITRINYPNETRNFEDNKGEIVLDGQP